MTDEQKQRAKDLIVAWKSTAYALHADSMVTLLQELIDAPEVEPVATVTGYYGGYLSIATVDGRVLPAGTALYTAPPAPIVQDGFVHVYVSGLTGSGKSAVAGEIEIAMRAIGLDVEWVNSESEKRLTHADYIPALELYKPKVRIFEVNIQRVAPTTAEAPADVARKMKGQQA